MKIHFEDWSDPMFLRKLDKKGVAHGGRIIKVFAQDDDPREIFGKPTLAVVEANHSPLTQDERFDYGVRGDAKGDDLEFLIRAWGLTERGNRIVRTLFRFSYEHGFSQAAMAAELGDEHWLISHPFDSIDGVAPAMSYESREPLIHLDLFFPATLEHLKSIVDYDDPDQILSMQERSNHIKSQMRQPK